jgi:hypothetical protein
MRQPDWYPLQSESHNDYKTSGLGDGDYDIAGIPPVVVKQERSRLAALQSLPSPVPHHTVHRSHHFARWAADSSDTRSYREPGQVHWPMLVKQEP